MYDVPDHLPTDPVLADLVPEFLEQWERDLTVTFSGIQERQDVEELRRFGHTIKGSFLQFGFRDLAGVGKEIMIDAENEDWMGALAKVNGILGVVQTLRRRIKNGEIS